MRFSFTVEVEVERESGKFASREDVLAEITEYIEGANPDQVEGLGADGESVYNIADWSVTAI